MSQRQFTHGWSYNDSITAASYAGNNLVEAPPLGQVRTVEVVRWRFIGAARSFQVFILDSLTGFAIVVHGRTNLIQGSYEARGPFVLPPTSILGLTPLSFSTTASAAADWVQR